MATKIAESYREQLSEIQTQQKANKELNEKVLALTEKQSANEKLLGARRIQSEYDKTVAAQEVSQKPKLVEDAPNALACGFVAIANDERVKNGLTPFATYAEYEKDLENKMKVQKQKAIADSFKRVSPTEHKVDMVSPLKGLRGSRDSLLPYRAEGEVFHIVSGGYYLGWNKSRCYIQSANNDRVDILVKGDDAGPFVSSVLKKNTRDLTRSEVDSIIQGKPALSDLFKVYGKFENSHEVYLDLSKAKPVW